MDFRTRTFHARSNSQNAWTKQLRFALDHPVGADQNEAIPAFILIVAAHPMAIDRLEATQAVVICRSLPHILYRFRPFVFGWRAASYI